MDFAASKLKKKNAGQAQACERAVAVAEFVAEPVEAAKHAASVAGLAPGKVGPASCRMRCQWTCNLKL